MSRWIIEAWPMPNHPETRGLRAEKPTPFLTDQGAKAYVRTMNERHYEVRVVPQNNPDGSEMDHAHALLWAASTWNSN